MSVSLYYQAKRSQPMSDAETAVCDKIVESYITGYPFDEMYEPFCVYDFLEEEFKEDNCIFGGAVKLPPMEWGEELFSDILYYWIDCLNEITDALPNAQWHINVDDIDLIRGEDGWNFAVSEE